MLRQSGVVCRSTGIRAKPKKKGTPRTECLWKFFWCGGQLSACFLGFGLGPLVTPADGVTLDCGALLAFLALGHSLECTATAHFLEDAFAVEHGLKTLEGTVYGLSFFDFDTSHKFYWIVVWLIKSVVAEMCPATEGGN